MSTIRRLSRLAAENHALTAVGVLLAVIAGLVLAVAGAGVAADVLWGACVAIVLIPLTWGVARTLLGGNVGVDAIALLAMAAALVARRVPGRGRRRPDAGRRQRAGGRAPRGARAAS